MKYIYETLALTYLIFGRASIKVIDSILLKAEQCGIQSNNNMILSLFYLQLGLNFDNEMVDPGLF